MSTITRDTNGYVCEIGDTSLKLYTLEAGIVELPIGENAPELAQYYNVFHRDTTYEEAHIDMPHLKFWAEDGVVFAQAIATGPNAFALPKEMRKKFRYVVWSPLLKYIDDSEGNIFNRAVKGGECGEVVVKYEPSAKSLWKVIRMVKWKEVPQQAVSSLMLMTPWTYEFLAMNMKELYVTNPDDLPSVNQTRLVRPYERAAGVCVKESFKNPLYNPLDKKAIETVSILWSPIFGLSRWCRTDNDVTEHRHSREPEAKTENSNSPLGCWYSYGLNDTRIKKEKRGVLFERRSTYLDATATKLVAIHPIKPTSIVDNGFGPEVEFECAFAYKHGDLELVENRGKDWEERFPLLRKDAHFYDIELGKVEIYPKESKEIIQAIESHREKLSPEERELRKDDVIIVCGQAGLLHKFVKNFEKYPANGLFVLRHVRLLKYLQTEETIPKCN